MAETERGTEAPTELTIHASTVAHRGRALAILGPSGSGKSALAMELIGLGASLVADDRTVLRRRGATLMASAPPTIAGLIEVRGLGLLHLVPAGPVPVAAAVDLGAEPTGRLPEPRTTELLGQIVPLYCRIRGAHFASALLQILVGATVKS